MYDSVKRNRSCLGDRPSDRIPLSLPPSLRLRRKCQRGRKRKAATKGEPNSSNSSFEERERERERERRGSAGKGGRREGRPWPSVNEDVENATGVRQLAIIGETRWRGA